MFTTVAVAKSYVNTKRTGKASTRLTTIGSQENWPAHLSAGNTGWQIVGAVLGRGTFLVGPSPRDPKSEALVLVPPGVRIPEPEDAEETVSTEDWRLATWVADEDGNRHVDVGHPQSVSFVSLAFVIGLVELECPHCLSWVADHLERRLLNACNASVPDAGGYVLPAAARWRHDAEAMLVELEIAVTDDPNREGDRFAEIPAELLPGDCMAEPLHPERHEPRLASGWLRNFYRERSREALAAHNGSVRRG